MIWYAVYILVAAFAKAHMDYRRILRVKGVMHALWWCIAAVITLGAASAVIWATPFSWPHLIPLLGGAAALYAAEHRLMLNALRKKHVFYVSHSNTYDSFWLLFTKGNVLQAGKLAYIAETSVFTISIIWLLWL